MKISAWILEHLPPDWRDNLLGIKRFRSKQKQRPDRQMLLFFVDGKNFHGGLCDRFKGIVSLFHYSLCKNIPFRICYTFPFDLSDYLLPNEYNWQAASSESVSYHFCESKYVNLIGDHSAERLLRLQTKRQIHAYANRDFVPLLNAACQTQYTWGELFQKLFRPSDELRTSISNCQAKIGGNYIGAAFRFQNLLGDFAEYEHPDSDEDAQRNLIFRCRQAILNLQNTVTCKRILVTSDSSLFLQSLADMPFVYAFPDKIVHIDTEQGETHAVYLKPFIDFYLLSEGQAVYSFSTKQMYKSDFHLYAAKVNNIPFERIDIE